LPASAAVAVPAMTTAQSATAVIAVAADFFNLAVFSMARSPLRRLVAVSPRYDRDGDASPIPM
jgi:hypothetical protein